MAYFLQQLINGLTLGAVYGLVAIGYTMVYGIIGMINFAHGEIYMIGAFITVIGFAVISAAGVGSVALALMIVLVVSILVTSLYGWSVERVAYRPLRQSTRLAPLISAIGMSILLQNYVQLLQGARVKTMEPVLQGSLTLMQGGRGGGDGFAVSVSYLQIVILFLTLGLMIAVSLLAICAAVLFLYIRFDNENTRFREGTLRGYARLLARAVQADNGIYPPAIPGSVTRDIQDNGGRFAIVTEA